MANTALKRNQAKQTARNNRVFRSKIRFTLSRVYFYAYGLKIALLGKIGAISGIVAGVICTEQEHGNGSRESRIL